MSFGNLLRKHNIDYWEAKLENIQKVISTNSFNEESFQQNVIIHYEFDSPFTQQDLLLRSFVSPPKVAVMTVVREFYVNAFKSPHLSTIVRERQVKYDSVTINSFFKIQNAPNDPDQVAQIDDTVDLDEVTQTLCDKAVPWTIVLGA